MVGFLPILLVITSFYNNFVKLRKSRPPINYKCEKYRSNKTEINTVLHLTHEITLISKHNVIFIRITLDIKKNNVLIYNLKKECPH